MPEPAILGPTAPVRSLRERLVELRAPIYGTKAQMWGRLADAERREHQRAAAEQEAERRRSALREGQLDFVPVSGVIPSEPNDEEKRRHFLTHTPSAPWCVHCICGKGVDSAHSRTAGGHAPSAPLVCADYCFMKTELGVAQDASEEFHTTLVLCERDSGMTAAMALPNKECSEFTTAWVVDFLQRLGLDRVTLRTDGEPSTTRLARAVAAVRPGGTRLEEAPKHSSASICCVERAHRTVQGQTRTLVSHAEVLHGLAFPHTHPVWVWAVRHAAWLYSRFHVKASGQTPHEAITSSEKTQISLPYLSPVIAS